MKIFRVILWVLVACVAGTALYLTLSGSEETQQGETPKFGTDFQLVNHKGEPITEKAFKGRNTALFFGFTHCPDICPTTLFEASGWLKDLGGDADKLDIYFFTVDPERDTPEIMNDYITAFDPRITGVTGDPETIKKVLSAYKVYSKKVDLGNGDYTMDHSAFVMLFDKQGAFKGTISYGENHDTALAKLRRLIGNG